MHFKTIAQKPSWLAEIGRFLAILALFGYCVALFTPMVAGSAGALVEICTQQGVDTVALETAPADDTQGSKLSAANKCPLCMVRHAFVLPPLPPYVLLLPQVTTLHASLPAKVFPKPFFAGTNHPPRAPPAYS